MQQTISLLKLATEMYERTIAKERLDTGFPKIDESL